MSLEGWKSLFEIGGVVLLFLTFVCGAGALWTSNKLNARQAAQLRQFDASLTDAKKTVETLKGDNLRLEAKALSLQIELLKQGPRENLLTEETRQALVDALKSFSGQKIDVLPTVVLASLNGISTGASLSVEERDGLAESLIGVLNDAHWNTTKALSNARFNVAGTGLDVHISPNAPPSTRNAAEALAKAIREVPLMSNGPTPDSDTPSEDTIILLVHPK